MGVGSFVLVTILGISGCATTSDAMELAADTLQDWSGDISTSGPVRVEVGGGHREEFYAYAQISGLEMSGDASGMSSSLPTERRTEVSRD